MLDHLRDRYGFREFRVTSEHVYAFIAGFVMAAIWSALLLVRPCPC